jgi:riboflavin kinase / FMN adenylyltransferase
VSAASGSAIAIGVFDGLHRGHRAIIGAAVERARDLGGRGVVVSFDPHPDVVLSKRFEPMPPLTPLAEKRARLLEMGVAEFHLLPFSREMAALEPEAFVDLHLMPLAPRALVVGEDFALGRARAGNVARLTTIGAARGFEVVAVPLQSVAGAPVTSTRIRAALAEGRVADAAELLGRRYDLTGVVVRGEAIGRTLGFPTANLRLHEEKLVPAHGIYATWVALPSGERVGGAMSIGVRPTFGGTMRTLEVFLLDWSGDLVGRDLTVEFVDRIREERHFPSVEALAEAIAEDVREIRRRLASDPPSGQPTPRGSGAVRG